MSRWRRRLHRRHSRSHAWQDRQRTIEMRNVRTIKVGSLHEALGVVGETVAAHGSTPGIRRVGDLLSLFGRQGLNDLAMKLGARLGARLAQKSQNRDSVSLLFDVELAPGQRAEVRPRSALRTRWLEEKLDYGPAEQVPIDSIQPFFPFAFGPSRGCPLDEYENWLPQSHIAFSSVRMNEGVEEMVNGAALAAFFVMQNHSWSTSRSATGIRFTVVNLGAETVRFTGQLEGSTYSEVK